MALKAYLRNLALFLVPRFPLINALTLLMLLAERASRETYPPFEPKMIYGHLGVLIITGVCMGFNMGRKPAALIHSGQLLFMAYSVFINEKLKYPEWVRIRMAHKMVGSAGIFLLYAFFTSPKPRNQHLRRMAEILIGLYLICAVYSLIESPEDKQGFLKLVPGGTNVLYVYTLFLCVAILCYLPGFYVNDITQVLLMFMLGSTILVDCRYDYWINEKGIDFWNQMRLIADSWCILFGLLMYITCTKKRVYDGSDDHVKRD